MLHITRILRHCFIVPCLILAGCAANVVVTGEYPAPLSAQIPVTAGFLFDENFSKYTFADDSGRKDVEIKFGDAQMRMFKTVADGLFSQSLVLKGDIFKEDALDKELFTQALNDASGKVDIIIVPQVEEVQVGMPYDTQLKVFEIWIKYKYLALDNNGNVIADWVMTSYGKTPTRRLTSASKALNQASIVALRDAGVRLVTGFAKVPEISRWLHQQLARKQTVGQES